MDFQLILYIIIVIVWLVLDNYRRIKKKQEAQPNRRSSPQPGEQDRPYTTLEDILREFGMEEEPEVVAPPKPQPRQQKKPAPHKPIQQSYETYESSINKDYKFSSETHDKGRYEPIRFTDTIKRTEIAGREKEDARRADIQFDLRKAIIWSEILKRPYA